MIRYLVQFLTILFVYVLGNILTVLLKIPISGSIIGLALLFLALLTGIVKLSWVEDIAQLHLRHITLLFIPLTVGVFHYSGIFRLEGFKLILTLALSSLAVLLATAFIAELFELKRKKGEVKND